MGEYSLLDDQSDLSIFCTLYMYTTCEMDIQVSIGYKQLIVQVIGNKLDWHVSYDRLREQSTCCSYPVL